MRVPIVGRRRRSLAQADSFKVPALILEPNEPMALSEAAEPTDSELLPDSHEAPAPEKPMDTQPSRVFFPTTFDEAWYRQQCPQLSASGLSPWEHYDHIGWKAGLDPSRYFWSAWYLSHNRDVAEAGVNPLIHYELHGAEEGRQPSPLFDGRWYASYYSLNEIGISPLAHYLWTGLQKGFAPRPEAVGGALQSNRTTSKLRSLWLERLTERVQRPGVLGYLEGPLSTGRRCFPLRGDDCRPNPVLDQLSEDIAREGVDIVPPYYVRARSVYVIPGTTSLVTEETIVNDEVAARPLADVSAGREKSAGTSRKGDHITVQYKSDLAPKIPVGFHLFKEYEGNYFHFLVELMPKLHVFEQTGADPAIPLLVSDDLDSRLYDIIDHLRHPRRKVLRLKRDVLHLVDDLHYISDVALIKDVYNTVPVRTHCFLPAGLIASLSAALKSRIVEEHRQPRNIYVARRSQRRKLLNEAEVIDMLIRHDFDIVTPEDLSFEAQVRIFSAARTIVGATGAAFTNMMWCAPGAKVVIMYPDHPFNNTTFWDQLGKISGVNVSYVTGARAYSVHGTYSMHDDFTIDMDGLKVVLA